ncbi:winged helix-turn-helix domain-containing protein [Thalassotalea sp. ND16A]|uniref:winged helix-turn-helix domain-containing protein n=1 Tax=Thalassotalea sp. ND16A TaxID=1535422 RepID=UPI00051A619A|nr:winged helix-turn-helix domain-containing protein [Thalassotalea sp. ND16A]KGJ98095.1 putative transcriptional regulator, CadC [Thalassotalea sp. ND16A]
MGNSGQLNMANCIVLGEFKIHLASERVFKDGAEIKLEPQIFACLALLIAQSPNVISREQIQRQVWAGRHVSDEAIRAAFKKLRNVLGDDARAPRYIKTVPRQGYKLVAEIAVTEETETHEVAEKKDNKKIRIVNYSSALLVAAIIILLLILSKWWQQEQSNNSANSTPADFQISKLTQLAGSEIYGSYQPNNQKIAFLHRKNSNAPQQIFIKDMVNNRLQQLTWDMAHYTDVHWSQDGRRLASTRTTKGKAVNIVIDFADDGSVLQLSELVDSTLTDTYVLGWAGNNGLYLAQEKYAASNRSIYRMDLPSQQLHKVTSPNVGGSGDYLAAESLDGKKLAIVREVADGEFALLIIELGSGALLANRVLPMFASRIIWHGDHNTLTVSAFNGLAVTFNIEKNSLESLPPLPAYSNDIFAECGERCYFMRQHNGNYFDIQEQPNPLAEPVAERQGDENIGESVGKNSAKQSSNSIVASDILALPGAQDLPTYSQDANSIYFATLTSQALMIHRKILDDKLQVIACWPSDSKLASLRINDDETYLAAIVNHRLVIESINSEVDCQQPPFSADTSDNMVSEPNYITHALEKVANPHWHPDNQSLFLTVYENGVPNIVSLNINSNKQTKVVSNYVSYQPVSGVQGYHGVAVDEQLIAWLLSEDGTDTPVKIRLAKLGAANSHRWAVTDKGLYFSTREGREAFLHARYFAELSQHNRQGSVASKRASIGTNSFRLGFDLHPNESKVLLVESLSAESDLVKIRW